MGLEGVCGLRYGGEGGGMGKDCVEVINWVIIDLEKTAISKGHSSGDADIILELTSIKRRSRR